MQTNFNQSTKSNRKHGRKFTGKDEEDNSFVARVQILEHFQNVMNNLSDLCGFSAKIFRKIFNNVHELSFQAMILLMKTLFIHNNLENSNHIRFTEERCFVVAVSRSL